MSATHAPIPHDRIGGVDLRGLSEEQMTALRLEAIRRGCSLSELYGQLVDEMAKRLLNRHSLGMS